MGRFHLPAEFRKGGIGSFRDDFSQLLKLGFLQTRPLPAPVWARSDVSTLPTLLQKLLHPAVTDLKEFGDGAPGQLPFIHRGHHPLAQIQRIRFHTKTFSTRGNTQVESALTTPR